MLKVPLEFPKAIYQGLTIYLLISIGWHGGEELASLSMGDLARAGEFMIIGLFTNTIIGLSAYLFLRKTTPLRQINAATVGGYYGSDSAGTFVTCLGVLTTANIAYASYMPVLLAVMEIPGCLVPLFLVSRLRATGKMDAQGNMPGDPPYKPNGETGDEPVVPSESLGAAAAEDTLKPPSIFNKKVLHEIFLNPGLFMLFGGIMIGFISRLQGVRVTDSMDKFFVVLFQGVLSLFLLEMGMTACSRLKDLGTVDWRFTLLEVLAPNIFATFAICVTHGYSLLLGKPFAIGTYALFAVLCAAASYIAVPAVQRLAIPEASLTLPLAASWGLTFTYNVTIGIPLYILIATGLTWVLPVH